MKIATHEQFFLSIILDRAFVLSRRFASVIYKKANTISSATAEEKLHVKDHMEHCALQRAVSAKFNYPELC